MKKLLLYTFLIGFLSSCEDPIDVTLESGPTQFVVDAWITNESKPQTIKLTYSQDYLDSAIASGVAGASVEIQSDNGNIFLFSENADGNYIWIPGPGESIGDIGDNYTLNIDINGEKITAQSSMNRVPVIDSIFQEFRDDEVFLDDGIYCQFFSRDFIGKGDTYWIKTFKNDTFLNRPFELNIAYDAAFDSGSEVDGLIFITPIREFANPTDDDGIPEPWMPGEKIRVEIHSMTNASFDYMETLRDQLLNGSNGIFAEPLANANGNIETTGDINVLGQFNVAAVSSIEEMIR
ncbi:MAG: DUF4249 domain-containing protein [Saprospiraceae bacterium]|nr:DUF4249 domain-containing protein [Saprospiraceae bacterium]